MRYKPSDEENVSNSDAEQDERLQEDMRTFLDSMRSMQDDIGPEVTGED